MTKNLATRCKSEMALLCIVLRVCDSNRVTTSIFQRLTEIFVVRTGSGKIFLPLLILRAIRAPPEGCDEYDKYLRGPR